MAKLRKGCLPQERNKLVTYLSRYEPETLTGNNGADRRRWGDKNKDAEGGEERERGVDHEEAVEVQEVEKDEEEEEEEEGEDERDLDDDDPNRTWDFSCHGREELQHELARYLSRSGLDRQGEEEEDSVGGSGRDRGPAKQSTTASASKPKGWSKGVRAQDRRRRAGEVDPAAVAAESESDPIEAGERRKSREGGDGKAKIWSKDVLAKVSKARKGSHSGPNAAPAAIGSVKPEPRLRLEARERERELEEEEERLRSLPIPIGDGAGSAVIGGLEPLPNSREEDQLKHLSRLLWDGEEEPADFALTYGSRPRTSLQ